MLYVGSRSLECYSMWGQGHSNVTLCGSRPFKGDSLWVKVILKTMLNFASSRCNSFSK